MLTDIILNMNNNGACEIHTQLLLYLSATNASHGLTQRCQAYMSALGVAVSYGSSTTLNKELSERYIKAWPSLRQKLLDRSTSRTWDPAGVNLDDQGRRFDPDRSKWIKVARAIIVKIDNYVKAVAVRRHLKHTKNSGQITTETQALTELRENFLEEPDTRTTLICPPYDDKLNEEFFERHGDAVCFRRAGGSTRAWKYDASEIGLFTRANCPLDEGPQFRLHDNHIGPQIDGSSSTRADYVFKFLVPNADIFDGYHIVFLPNDTEYTIHLAACLEKQKPRRKLPRPKPKPPRSTGDGLVALEQCPPLNSRLQNASIEIDMMTKQKKHGREVRFLKTHRGHIVKFYEKKSARHVTSKIHTELGLLHDYMCSHQGEYEDEPAEPTWLVADDERKEEEDAVGGLESGARWFYVKWMEAEPPGYGMNLLAPASYSARDRGELNWRILK